MIADLTVAHIAAAGAVAASVISILVRTALQKRTTHRDAEAARIRGRARLRRPPRQQALLDDPDITVPPLAGFDVDDGRGVYTVNHGAR